jgi:putative colanic acid biosysnthesis UDP-glucose lipid carrier transferase
MKHLTAQNLLTELDHPEAMAVAYETPNIQFIDSYFPLDHPSNQFVKRIFDLLCSSVLILLVLSWLLPLVALLIKLDSKGPVFFLQKRNKKGGRLFTCIKFRTMVVNKEADLVPAIENDRRITRLGWFLRKHHLDEMPQLLNVWWGDMSMIGPRPHMVSDNSKYAALLNFYAYRHRVKPGITGLAQVLGYVGSISNLDHMKERVRKDIYYIHNWSPALDVRIIYGTIFKMIGKRESPEAAKN